MSVRAAALTVITALVLAGCAQAPPAPPPHASDVRLQPETETIAAKVPRNATLDSLLRQHQLAAPLVDSAVNAARAVFNLRQLRADRPYRLVRSVDGMLREFEYQIDADRFLRIFSRSDTDSASLDAEVLPYKKDTAVVAAHGNIDREHSSLIAAIDGAGERVQLALALADVFSGQIDFDSDLQPGDSFDVLFEETTREGDFAGYGVILGARFTSGGRDHLAFRWRNPDTGRAGYYDADGRSLKRFMLKSPLQFQVRVTSRFSQSRLHPIYRTYRPHLGVDYGAPVGSPVIAVADGTVVSAGYSGEGGNMVRIRHTGGLESYYLHLSVFGGGVRAGAHVQQGQVIGRVGATGAATGPHLDFRLRRNGVFVNPLAEHSRQPPGDPIPSVRLADFRAVRDGLFGQLTTTVLAEDRQRKPDAARAIH